LTCEFDGHRLDVRLKVVVRDPLGFEQEFEIERIWLLVIVDVWSRAVLGYHVSLNREYSRYDVIRTIENALAPHRPRQFTLPGVGYGAAGGLECQAGTATSAPGLSPRHHAGTLQRLSKSAPSAPLSPSTRR